MADPPDRTGRSRRHGAARPDHHDPTAGIGGAPPAQSALTLRLVLAVIGLIICAGGALWLSGTDETPGWLVVTLAVLGLVAVVDIAVILRRKRRGEPG